MSLLGITAKKNQLDIATSLLEYGAKTDAESKVKSWHYQIGRGNQMID